MAVQRPPRDELTVAERNFGDFLEHPVSELAAPLVGAELSADDAIPAGTRVGPYRVVRELGRGGMGVVCLAEPHDGDTGRVALKILVQRLGIEPLDRRRFREERDILASLDHPGIPRLLGAGDETDGAPWFAMQYVDGSPIDAFGTAHALDAQARLELFADACDAVEHAHARSIVHRDIKPANILVCADGTVKLLDFGIARLAPRRDSFGPLDPTLTQRASQRLTPAYASPEQLRGERAGTASDVYALGVLVYRLLTGRVPPRRTEDIVHRSAPQPRHAPRLDAELPRGVAGIAARALHPDARCRYETAGALAAAVRACLPLPHV